MTDNTDPKCPRCEVVLQPERASFRTSWRCHNCSGRAVGLAVLRELFTQESINPLWLSAVEGEGPAGCACPSCRNAMTVVPLSGSSDIRVDVCRLCQFVWFDIRETDGLIPQPVQEPPQVLPERAMEVIGLARIEQITRESEKKKNAERWQDIAIALWLNPFG